MAEDLAYLEALLNQENTKQSDSLANSAYSSIQSQDQQNLIVWQLELDNILERTEHLLKGDVLTEDGQGNVFYTKSNNSDLRVINDYGAQLIMNVLSQYLNRNTILSNYREERIYEILLDLGNELADLVYINYEKMGLDTVEKKSRSNLIIIGILHTIESAYNRSLHGEERDSLRTARVVQQTQPLGNPQLTATQPKKGSKLNPFNWFRG